MKIRSFLLVLLLVMSVTSSSQEYNGTTGLLHVPSAETDAAGTFRGYVMFLDQRFTPNQLQRNGEKYNTYSYGVGITVFPWLEMSYQAALLYMHKNGQASEPLGYYNEDRHVDVKLRPLKEGKWWPAVALGMDDVGRFEYIKEGNNTGNNYFQNFYIAASKHVDIKGCELGAHVAYRYYPSEKNKEQRGVAGGLTLRPSFYRPLRFVGEWDGVGVNVGADVLLWRHLFLQACLVHGAGFTGGLSYHFIIPH